MAVDADAFFASAQVTAFEPFPHGAFVHFQPPRRLLDGERLGVFRRTRIPRLENSQHNSPFLWVPNRDKQNMVVDLNPTIAVPYNLYL